VLTHPTLMVFSVLFDPMFPVSLYVQNASEILSRIEVMTCDV